MKTAKVHQLDIEQLACHILGIDYDEIDGDTDVVEEKLYEKFEVSLENFTEIVSHLLPLIDIGKGSLTDIRYKGFVDIEKGLWLVKTEI